jgi:hypothetical protein
MKKRVWKKKKTEEEEKIEDIKFNVHKFNNRHKPTDRRRILIIGCLSEFGSEIIGCMYCIPRILQLYPGYYTIAVGWYGRQYLYRHLVDEFWETKEEHQWLRDYCVAFHNISKNLDRLEKSLNKEGRVLPSAFSGNIAVGNICNDCRHFWGGYDNVTECRSCKSKNIIKSIFGDIDFYKSQAVHIPLPSKEKMEEADTYLKPNPVGVFARNRSTYGRNLQPEFYMKLIERLEKMGYNPIWLGEKQSTLACPATHICDMSRRPEARDLELTLAIVSKLKFTVQYWTASTRLAAIVGTPFLIFESPDQIWALQEGIRMNLATTGPKKMCLSHYLNVYNDNDTAIDLTEKCVREIEQENYEDVMGMLEEQEWVEYQKRVNFKRIGSKDE